MGMKENKPMRKTLLLSALALLAVGSVTAFARRGAGPATPSLDWPDRRIIGTIFLASSAQGDRNIAAGFANNPRRYFTDGNAADFDVRDQPGLGLFQQRMLKQASDVVANLRRMHAQGAITWDIEGEQYPQDTSYVCSPDQIAEIAPEMESVVMQGRFKGMRLDDAYFKTLRDAGFRVGVCIRPQHFELGPDGHARQVSLPEDQVANELIRKMRYAHDRWGATIFYADSTVKSDGRTLDTAVLEQAAAAIPGSLMIPEESTEALYRTTAPFQTFLFHGDTGTSDVTRALYPRAFSANLVNDVDPGKLEAHRAQLTDAVRHGDVLMVHAGYWQPNNDVVMSIYRAAGQEP